MRNKLLIIILLIGLNCSAQEYLSGFSYETKTVDRRQDLRGRSSAIQLPFFDDFTESDVYPDVSKWQSNDVLVNSGFPVFPTNYNAATLDILDVTGKVYSNASSSPFIADSLISNPISLKGITPADSVYFSFYYQPQGNGDAPETSDSLVLMIGCHTDTVFVWNHIWSAAGISLDSFLIANEGNYFKQVMIPIVDDKYFENEIVILFYNYGSVPSTMYPNDRSNVDNWNIDFVYLNKNRTFDDTTFPLVTFSEKMPSLLKRYQSMPYRQYVSNPTVAMVTDYNMYIANLDSVGASVEYTLHVENVATEWSFDYSSKWCNVSPFATNGFQNCNGDNATQACPHLKNFLFDMNDKIDTATYRITNIISVDEATSNAKGDTLYGLQSFKNYYAYDDGIPERGYGVVPGESCFASQFSISMPDTLSGVYLLFNRTHKDANYDFFDIVVWNNNNGKPGNEIYRLENQRPIWDDDEIYKFAYYPFDKILKVNGIIYVGIMQHEKESINIGFDASKDNSQYNFYDVGYGWENSSMKGSLMIRPVLGNDMTYIKEENHTQKTRLGLYPNPSKNEINISELESQSCEEIMIFDMTGRLKKCFANDVKLDISDLPNGLYMIRVVTEEGKIFTEKFMISR
ncbi:MAG: T9SS type A sorting domain-containing protein [Bacteroidales bacterium]|nr:T9SS type A sorting domain-containing protein [Bacteroidales bacterium]